MWQQLLWSEKGEIGVHVHSMSTQSKCFTAGIMLASKIFLHTLPFCATKILKGQACPLLINVPDDLWIGLNLHHASWFPLCNYDLRAGMVGCPSLTADDQCDLLTVGRRLVKDEI